jgi:hypothetical protein
MSNPYFVFSPFIQNRVLDLILGELDKGEGCPRAALNIYTSGGPQRGILLSTLYMSLPSFTKSVEGSSESYEITPDTNASASGTAAYFELVDRNKNMVIGGAVGAVGSGAIIELNKTTITAGDTVIVEKMRVSLRGARRAV